jgi:gliding motility-associated-like protein
MKITTAFIFLICSFFLAAIPGALLYGQLPLKTDKDNKPVFKDGKFYFYGSSYLKNSISNLTINKNKVLNAPCNFCTVQQASRRLVITSGPIILYITSNDATCGYGSGSIIVQAANGTAPYSFNLDGYTTQLTGNFPVVGAGMHIITVTDATGATTTANVTLINTFPGPVIVPFFITTTPSSCSSSDGVVQLQASGGTPPYLYSLDLINFQTNNVFSGLPPGSYNFYAKDANGCIGMSSDIAFATNLCQYQLTGVSIPANVCGNQGDVSLSAVITPSSNGTFNPPYSYSLDGINYQNTGDFNNLPAGIYKLYIKDGAGTANIYGFNIAENCFVSIQYIAVSAACQQNNGSLSVTATNGTAPYLYTIDGINYQASNTFTGLAPGNYYITVKDATRVTSSLRATVYDRCPVVEAVATDETCAKNDGVITAAGFKGTPPYQYSIDGVNFQNSNSFTGLVSGSYTITIRDALGFTGTIPVTVNYNCLKITSTITNTTCGNSNGSINATAVNGTAPFQYSIDGVNFQATGLFNNLVAATYTITLKDFNGLVATAKAFVSNTPGPQINIAIAPASCKNNDGGITINTTGGTAPFQYSVDGINFSNSNSYININSGASVTGTVKDANGCTASQTIIMTEDCPTGTVVANNETCSSKNGTITISAANGTAPYQYSIDGISFQNSNLFGGLAAASYTVTVKDALGYTNKVAAVINNICPTVTAATITGLCGTANASITATGANGTAPYLYSIDGTNFQGSNNFTNLSSGTYIVTIKDADGLKNTDTISLTNIPGPQITANAIAASCLNNDGAISAGNIGGTSPFQYSIDGINFQNTGSFTNLDTGIKTIVIKDINGCKDSATVSVPFTNNLFLKAGNDTTICEGLTSVLHVNSNALSYSWSPATGLNNNTVINPSASPVITTTYSVTGTIGICSKVDSVTVFVNAVPVAEAGKDTSTCYGKSVQLTGSGGISYLWSPAQYLDNPAVENPTVVNPENTVTYNLTVIGGNGCKSTQPAKLTVTVTPPPKIFAGNDTAVIINQPLPLHAVDLNNSGFDNYQWSPPLGLDNPSIQNPIALITKDITYTVIATTADGCEGTGSINIKTYAVSDIFVPNAFTPDGNGHNDILKVIPIGVKELKYFAVYNRWGKQVFYTKNQSTGWDGTINGKKQDTGTYVWMAAGIDYKGNIIDRKGTVILIR